MFHTLSRRERMQHKERQEEGSASAKFMHGLVDEVRSMSCKSLRLRCFTLVELLVVITVILILAGLLMPALKKARDKSKAIQCLSNQKQITVGFLLYADSYNGWCRTVDPYYSWAWIQGSIPMDGAPQGKTGCGFISGNPYLSPDVFACPGGPRRMHATAGKLDGWNCYGGAYPIRTTPSNAASSDGFSTKLVLLKRPSKSLTVIDTIYAPGSSSIYVGAQASIWLWHALDYTNYGNVSIRHNNRSNVGYFDGHAASADGVEFLDMVTDCKDPGFYNNVWAVDAV